MNKKENNKNGAWWRMGVLFFAKVSGYIVGPILVALFLGKYLDRRFDSAPWWFLGLTAVAFVVSSIAIVRQALKQIEKTEKIDAK